MVSYHAPVARPALWEIDRKQHRFVRSGPSTSTPDNCSELPRLLERLLPVRPDAERRRLRVPPQQARSLGYPEIAIGGLLETSLIFSGGGRDVLVYAPPTSPALEIEELKSVIPLQHYDTVLRWCTMGSWTTRGRPFRG